MALGRAWRDRITVNGARRVLGAEIEAADPANMAQRWCEVLGLKGPIEDGTACTVSLRDGHLRFVRAGARGDGLGAFTLAVPSIPAVVEKARSRKLPVEGSVITLCGVQFALTETK